MHYNFKTKYNVYNVKMLVVLKLFHFKTFISSIEAPIQHDPPSRQERIRSSLGLASNKILPRAHREYYPT